MKEITKTFKNCAELGDWWTKNPTAKRTKPEIVAETIEEYNKKNHEIKFPCEMTFEL